MNDGCELSHVVSEGDNIRIDSLSRHLFCEFDLETVKMVSSHAMFYGGNWLSFKQLNPL